MRSCIKVHGSKSHSYNMGICHRKRIKPAYQIIWLNHKLSDFM